MPLTLSSIRKKARKTQDPYTTDEILNTWSYLENLEQNPQYDDASLNDLTAAKRKNRILSTKDSLKKIDQVRLQELMTADLSRYTDGELDTLRRFLRNVSSSDLNEALLPRIEAREKVLQEEPEQLHSIQNEAPVEEPTETETEVEAQNDDVINESIIDDPQSPVAPPQEDNSEEVETNAGFADLDLDDYRPGFYDNNQEESTSSIGTVIIGEPEEEDKDDDKDEYQKNEELILKEVYGVPSLFPEDIPSNLETLGKYPENDKLFEKDENGKAKHPEFEDILNVIDHIEITKQTPLGREEKVPENEKIADINMFLQQVRHETEIYLANRPYSSSLDDFKQEFAERLRLNLLQLGGANMATTFDEKRDALDKFGTLARSFSGDHKADKFPIKQDTLIGYQTYKQSMAEKALAKMEKVLGPEKAGALNNLTHSVKHLDFNLQKKYGKKYSLVKNIFKSAGWGAAYGLAATTGPVGIAAVATASFANQTWGMYKDYKKQKQQIAGRIRAGEKVKPLTFGKYLSQNKMRLAGMALTASTVALGIGGAGGMDVSSLQSLKSTIGLTMAGGGAFHQAAQAYKAAPKGKKTMAAAKALGASVVGFAAGWLAGGAAAGSGHDTPMTESNAASMSDLPNNHEAITPEATPEVTDSGRIVQEAPTDSLQQSVPTAPAPVSEQINQPTDSTTVVIEQHTPTVPQTPEQSNPAPVQENAPVVSEVAPAIDVNNLTSEQQHDMKMLFLRDPAEANEILGNDGDKWLNSRELQEAWDKGEISAEQKEALVKFAGERFDDKGNFVDMEGKTSAAAMEADAKAWSSAHQSHDASEADKPFPTQEEAALALSNEASAEPQAATLDNNQNDPNRYKAVLGSDVEMSKLDNGSYVFAATMANGVPVHVTMDPSGTVTDMVVNAHGKYADYQCTENEIKNVNEQPAFEDMRESLRSRITAVESTQTVEISQPSNIVEVQTPENSSFSDVKVDKNNGDISFDYTRQTGTVVHATMSAEGELKALAVDAHGDTPAHEYTKRELSQMNNTQNFKEITQSWHQDISAMINGTESENVTIYHPDLDRVNNASQQGTPVTAEASSSGKVLLTPQQLQNARGRG